MLFIGIILMVINMSVNQDLFKDSISEYKKNISSLQAINVIYVTIIFFIFVLGLSLLGTWAFLLGAIILPMFSISYNYIAQKVLKDEEVKIKDMFVARKGIFHNFSQYFSIYRSSILWGFLGYYLVSAIGLGIYFYVTEFAGLMNSEGMVVLNVENLLDEMTNSPSFIKFSLIIEVLGLIGGYFLFTLKRQKFQFVPIILLNCPLNLQGVIDLSKSAYYSEKSYINKGNLKFLAWWLFALAIGSGAYFLFENLGVFSFDVSLLLAIFIFLFIGSFSIAIKVLFKNNLYHHLLSVKIENLKEQIYTNSQD